MAGCSGSPDVGVSVGPTASAAPAAGSTLAPADFAAALKRPGTTLLDVRTPAEFAGGHLPGAVNLDVSAPDFATRLAALDPAAPYAVYCHSGNRSGAAVAEMSAAGFADAYDLEGGIGAWQDAGGEVVTG
ncbi:rhodanese-like domain-containing protein [Phycicoccus sp. MQZ13P-5]|uniref:Rhodanese-like domain-containing protein n=1 Tax=Phycicoccus sonneratiae TaxID=2807628 RepID=A0ABS2CHI1_9MICO|nr:rhodanese-like domain-containing protein [Phycicoccus sonneraticus]